MIEKKALIIQTTHQLFKDKGYLETSVQDILNASNISKATFYKYFTSKGSLTLELLQQLQEKMNAALNIMVLNESESAEDDLIRKTICFIKKFENDNALRPIISEAIVEREPELISFINQRRQKSIHWLYEQMDKAFGKTYPNAILDATLFLQALVKELMKVNYSSNPNVSIEMIVNRCYDRMLICLENMNQHPIFDSKSIIEQSDIIFTGMEQFMQETMQLNSWLKENYEDSENKELFVEYLKFLVTNREHLSDYPGMLNQITASLKSELINQYPKIGNYLQILKHL
ncbi:MAG: TetR/AcrR family transcriptional regulator [Paenibacillaceae bacterium]|jgi:AcrR family transcriptional regulator|nr:TetR/AcrR family transcriptional regulator [Paenibacillaceae bacterium]